MIDAAREAHAAALRRQDRSALAVASRDLRYWSARRATTRVLPSPADTTEVHFGSLVTFDNRTVGNITRFVGEPANHPLGGRVILPT
jgi:transcription elongation GreA/GreB family factor